MPANKKKPTDWFRIIVHFLFGFFIGACIGIRLVGFFLGAIWDELIILACALSVGTIGAIFGDRFWNWLFSLYRQKQ